MWTSEFGTECNYPMCLKHGLQIAICAAYDCILVFTRSTDQRDLGLYSTLQESVNFCKRVGVVFVPMQNMEGVVHSRSFSWQTSIVDDLFFMSFISLS